MKSRTRLGFLVSSGFLVCTAALLLAAEMASPSLQPPPPPADLIVHEWGTFTSVAGEDGSAIDWDALGCTNDLPGFVNDFGYRGLKWRLQGTVRMETPVLYFYSPRTVDAQVRVRFPKGLITEWYPKADAAAFQSDRRDSTAHRIDANLTGIDTSLQTVTGTIEWPHVMVQPDTRPMLPLEPGPSRYYAARETGAAPLAVGDQHEKFLFYRGVGRFPIPLSVRLTKDGTTVVENVGHEIVPSAILFENRGGRVGYRDLRILQGKITLDPPILDEDVLPQLRLDLENVLIDQGLNLKEAQAMVATWRDSWFEEGARLIYIMPASAVDSILPLHVAPSPARTVRVFVGRIELLTPRTVDAVEQALATRDAASLDLYRRFLDPILQRISLRDPEAANRDQLVLQQMQQRGLLKCH